MGQDFDFCGQLYTDKCSVTVNGGKEAGGFGPLTSPAEVSEFLKQLHNDMGVTNIKFAVTSVQGSRHTDTWVADNGTGACDADWVQIGSSWKIERDAITFTPKDKEEPQIGAATDVPADIVNTSMKAFEDAYNREDFGFCGECYTEKCTVTVNGGKEAGGFGPFTSPAEVSDFLKQLRNDLGGTNILFTVTSVQGSRHTDTWVADNGTGACSADWVQVGSSWKIERDAITFTPTPTLDSAVAPRRGWCC